MQEPVRGTSGVVRWGWPEPPAVREPGSVTDATHPQSDTMVRNLAERQNPGFPALGAGNPGF